MYLLFCFLLFVPSVLQRGHAQDEVRDVLILHSYHFGLKWTDDIQTGIHETLTRDGMPVDMQMEYLDAKRYGGEAFYQKTASLLEMKLANRKYDVVLTSDDYALRFVLDHRDNLFADVPVVFCGVNRFRAAMVDGMTGITGVVETPAFAPIIELALQLHPEITEMVVINQSETLTGRANRALLDALLPRFQKRVRFRFWSDLSWRELEQRLVALKPGQVLLLTDVVHDEQRGVLSFEETCRRVRRCCAVPIYGPWDFFLEQGIVGGKLISGREQGRQAGELALRVLVGEKAEDLPVVDGDMGRFMFDSKELRRFSIAQGVLPADSIVVNQDRPVYVLPRTYVINGLIVLGGMTLFGGLLLKNLHSRYRAEKALRESEEQLSAFFDLNMVGMVTAAANAGWLHVNDRFCEILGYSREELWRTNWFDLSHPEELALAHDTYHAMCAGEADHVSLDKRFIAKDGSVVYAHVVAKVKRCPDGRVERFFTVVQDITERKRVEAALRLDEARLEALLALSQMRDMPEEEVVNFIVSSATRLTGSPVGYLAFVSESEGALIKHGWVGDTPYRCSLEKLPFHHKIAQAGLWAEAGRHQKPIVINDYALPDLVKKGFPEGHVAIQRFLGVPLVEDDKVVAIIGVANKAEKYVDADIRQMNLLGQGLVRLMEAHRVEQGLVESRQEYKRLSQQFQTLLDGIPDAIFLLTRDMRIVWGNDGAQRQLGTPEKALAGNLCEQLCHGRTVGCSECPVIKCLKGGRVEEGKIVAPDGRIWGVKSFPLRGSGEGLRNVILLASDITEKVKLRKKAERAGRLASLGELAAGVAHEINNPNGVLMLNTKILSDLFEDIRPILPGLLARQGLDSVAGLDVATLDEEIPQVLSDMRESSKRISRIVTDLKDFVQAEQSSAMHLVDLNAVVKTSLRLTGNMLRKSTHNYSVCYAPHLPKVKGNFQQLEQVLVNLIVNACQALNSKNQGVFVTTRFDATGECCVVEVRDEGQGIDAKDLPRIMEPFFTTKRQGGGTGLGLSISARIVRDHQGNLDVSSQSGQGTTARVLLPFIRKEETV
jgi:PAS domain S-box-containing protein